MSVQIVGSIVAIILGALWGVSFYVFKQQGKKVEKLEETTAEQQLEIQALQGKIWGEEKLQSIVQEAVCNAMTQFKLELYEEGILKPKNKIKE